MTHAPDGRTTDQTDDGRVARSTVRRTCRSLVVMRGGAAGWQRPARSTLVDERHQTGAGDTTDEIIEIEVFATGRTILIPADDRAHGDHPSIDVATIGEQLQRAGHAVHEGFEHARAVRAAPGHRPGRAIPTTPDTASRRRGGGCDIVHSIHLDPVRACAAATSGRWLDHPVDRIELLDDSAAADLLWEVEIVGHRRTAATLHLLASPSMVVTVLELIPHERLRWRRSQFIRDGVAAAESLAGELVGATAD